MKVSKIELDLDKVLPMGQAFRWQKFGAKWIGVIKNTIFMLNQEEFEISIETFPKLENPDEIFCNYFGSDTKNSI